jgi:hypothetical protein
MAALHKPAGRPDGGQFARTAHGYPPVGLRGDLHVDKEAATYFADQVDSIQAEGLKGSLSGRGNILRFTSTDGRSFDIHQDGHLDEDGTPGWAIDNHDCADDAFYGLRSESRSDNLGEDLAGLIFESQTIEAFTLNGGSDDYEFLAVSLSENEHGAVLNADFVDSETGDDLSVYYDIDERKLTVYYDGSELVTDKDRDEVLQDLTDCSDLDAPEGSPSGRMAWHMERSIRVLAAKDDAPDWIHHYRTAGLTWEDRN